MKEVTVGRAGTTVRLEKHLELFQVCLKHGKTETWLDSSNFTCMGQGTPLSYRYAGEADEVEIKIDFTLTQDELLSTLTATHRGDGVLYAVKYPCVRKEDVAPFEQLLMSSAWGDCIQQPTKTIRDVSTSTSIRFDQDYIKYAPNEVIYTYPSIMAMQYMVLFSPARSLYVATYSTANETMTFHAKTLGKYALELSVNHYPFACNQSWTSPQCSIAVLGGGWHGAADLYASHMRPQFPAPQSPAWMREDYHGWAEFMLKREKEQPAIRFTGIPEKWKWFAEHTGMEHLFLVGWHDNGHDTMFPRYLPCEQEGTPEELARALREVQAQGGRVSLYTNARLIDTTGDFYRQGGKDAVSLDEDGNEYLECYGTASVYATSCPGCQPYVDQMALVATRIAGEYGADGMFVDQISCNLDFFCYNTAHGHSRPSNNFLPGVQKELTTMRRTYETANPDFHTFAEGCHERFSSFYDVNQGHGEEYTWQIGKSMPEQYLYTFPDRIVTGHCADKQQMYHSMAQFKPLDIKEGCYLDESNHEPLRKYIALRKANKPYFLQGTFLDCKGFEHSAGIRVFAVRATDNSLCAALWQPGALEQSSCEGAVRLPAGYVVQNTMFSPAVSVEEKGGWTQVKWNGALCYLVLTKDL